MRLLEPGKGAGLAFEHSEEYQQTQHKFLAAAESMEPNNIVVRGCPWCGPGGVWRPGLPGCHLVSTHPTPPHHRSCFSQALLYVDSLSCSSATHAAFRMTRDGTRFVGKAGPVPACIQADACKYSFMDLVYS